MDNSEVKNSQIWDGNELRRLVKEGIFRRCRRDTEHIALHPYWLSNIQQGIEEDLEHNLGRWMPKFGGYLVAYNNVRRDTTKLAMINVDQPWIHIDVKAKFFIYEPKVGQILQGTVTKIGKSAAVCTLFKHFIVTVDPGYNSDFENWTVNTELEFEVTSVNNRPRAPVIGATCVRVLDYV